MKTYPPETRKRAYALLDSGVPAAQVAQKLGVEKNTLYVWASARGRKKYADALGIISVAIKTRKPGRPRKSEISPMPVEAPAPGPVSDPTAPMTYAALVTKVDELRRENAGLKRIIAQLTQMVTGE